MMKLAVLSCVLTVALSAGARAADCVVPSIRTLENQTVQGHMYAKTGRRCSIMVLGSRGPMVSVRLLSSPSHGAATVQGQHVVYRSSPGFVGEDHFAYVRHGADALNRPVTKGVEVTVHVSEQL
ncbi:Ig-like domain-containing protein [Bradyrhizobium sp. HKCCYLS20291]|uniref:Ig-like domain-containing protein n=1 Tax=Bradyrhizobium sp. HKCCYLS20291 TaxID=3420766 RepID=UPI003EC1142B